MRDKFIRLRIIIGCSLLLLCIGVALADIEDWPLTSAPMFGDAVRADAPRYRFRIELTDDNDKYVTDLNSWRANVGTAPYWRGFFGHVYGAPSGTKPFSKVGETGRDERIESFLRATFERAGFEKRRGRLVIDTVRRESKAGKKSVLMDRVISTEILGYYSRGEYRPKP